MEDFFMSHMYDNKEIVYMQWKYMNELFEIKMEM